MTILKNIKEMFNQSMSYLWYAENKKKQWQIIDLVHININIISYDQFHKTRQPLAGSQS